MFDYHSEFYKLVVVTGGQDYDMNIDQEVLREILRQAREAANEGRAQLQAELQNALQQIQGQVQQIRQQQLAGVNGAGPDDDLRARPRRFGATTTI